MTSQEFQKIAKKLPDLPGVYLFKDEKNTVLYVGKATSLRDRVRSYFSADLVETRGEKLVDMVFLAKSIDHVQTDSVLEALILEANLIRFHQPKYNTIGKDNSSWNYVLITDEAFPKVLLVRGRMLAAEQAPKAKYLFGPFPYGGQLHEALKIIRQIFPFRDEKCTPASEQKRQPPRPCFNRQIGLCPGVCTGEISQEEYAEQIEHIKLFFEGKKRELLSWLETDMNEAAKKEEFEKAGQLKRTMFALTHIQDIALLKRQDRVSDTAGGDIESFNQPSRGYRIEAYDVAHTSTKQMVGVMVAVINGEAAKSEYRKFRIRQPKGGDTAALAEVLQRRFTHFEWPLPHLIVVDGAQAQLTVARKIIAKHGFNIDLVAVVKDERHKPRDILGKKSLVEQHKNAILLANAEAHRFAVTYHRRRRDKIRRDLLR